MKKEITIKGTALKPITVGNVAFIEESSGATRRTSVVIRIERKTRSEIKFETKNTVYTLLSEKKEPIAAFMVKKMFEMRERQ